MDNQTERARTLVDLAKAQLMADGYKGENPRSIMGRLNAYSQGKAQVSESALAREVAKLEISREIWKKPEIRRLDNFEAFMAVMKGGE